MIRRYRKSSKIKILTLTWLMLVSILLAIVFSLPILIKITPTILLMSIIFVLPTIGAVYYSTLPTHRKSRFLLKFYLKSIRDDAKRMSYISSKEALFDSYLVLSLIVLVLILATYSWFNPASSIWTNWVVGLCACPIFNYSWRDRTHRSNRLNTNRLNFETFAFYIIMLVYVLFIILYIIAPDYLIFSKDNTSFLAYILSTSAWFSFGVLSAFIPAQLNLLKRIIIRT